MARKKKRHVRLLDRTVTVGGKRRTAWEWMQRSGLRYGLVFLRVHRGWPLRRAVTEAAHQQERRHPDPRHPRHRALTIDGKTKTTSQWARDNGISRQLLNLRLDSGWSRFDAATKRPWQVEHRRHPSAAVARKRRLAPVTIDGETKRPGQWAKTFGLTRQAVANRINQGGWTPLRAITTPPLAPRRKFGA